ncbi:MAG: unnamed protein product [uncultured Paraburkholderia sp.]|nr:MAG: unnamed protein product [uncultured Paraburkholderia sp.]CAH2943843.1 MAG: unnamed protein product [uncultured Paraburkholderia sp.]
MTEIDIFHDASPFASIVRGLAGWGIPPLRGTSWTRLPDELAPSLQPVLRLRRCAQHDSIANRTETIMIMPVSHSLSLKLARLLNLFGVVSLGEGAGGAAQPAAAAGDGKAAAGVEVTRARSLMKRLESVGVRFPAEVYEALEQAEAALNQDHWTLQVDHSFYSGLELLESAVVRHGGAPRLLRPGAARGGRAALDGDHQQPDESGRRKVVSFGGGKRLFTREAPIYPQKMFTSLWTSPGQTGQLI